MEHTRVSFADGRLAETSRVRLCRPRQENTAVITDLTPFHPQSHLWPDQPWDQGTLTANGESHRVDDCRMGVVNGEGELFVDQEIPVKRGEPGWAFVVVHLLAERLELEPGTEVSLEVDAKRRLALSLGHSACHLASLALNRALAPYWRKEPDTRDAFGQIDFDRLAITASRVGPLGSRDTYRLGKSLRKKGFNSSDALAELPAIEARINEQLASWLRQGGTIRQQADGPAIIDSRYWHCELDGQGLVIPCGGTHVSDLARFEAIHVRLCAGETELEMATRVTAAGLNAPGAAG